MIVGTVADRFPDPYIVVLETFERADEPRARELRPSLYESLDDDQAIDITF